MHKIYIKLISLILLKVLFRIEVNETYPNMIICICENKLLHF